MASTEPERFPVDLDVLSWRRALWQAQNREQLRLVGLALIERAAEFTMRDRLVFVKDIVEQAERFGAKRVCVFAGRPLAKGSLFAGRWEVSNIHRVARVGWCDPVNYQNLIVDREYMELMKAMAKAGSLRVDPVGLGDSLLGELYRAEKVVDSLVVPLGEIDGVYYYFSAARYEGVFTAGERISIEALGLAARTLLGSVL